MDRLKQNKQNIEICEQVIKSEKDSLNNNEQLKVLKQQINEIQEQIDEIQNKTNDLINKETKKLKYYCAKQKTLENVNDLFEQINKQIKPHEFIGVIYNVISLKRFYIYYDDSELLVSGCCNIDYFNIPSENCIVFDCGEIFNVCYNVCMNQEEKLEKINKMFFDFIGKKFERPNPEQYVYIVYDSYGSQKGVFGSVESAKKHYPEYSTIPEYTIMSHRVQKE
jgi:hypothetical protein